MNYLVSTLTVLVLVLAFDSSSKVTDAFLECYVCDFNDCSQSLEGKSKAPTQICETSGCSTVILSSKHLLLNRVVVQLHCAGADDIYCADMKSALDENTTVYHCEECYTDLCNDPKKAYEIASKLDVDPNVKNRYLPNSKDEAEIKDYEDAVLRNESKTRESAKEMILHDELFKILRPTTSATTEEHAVTKKENETTIKDIGATEIEKGTTMKDDGTTIKQNVAVKVANIATTENGAKNIQINFVWVITFALFIEQCIF